MKRSFNEFYVNNIPDYVIKMTDAIRENNSISLYLSKNDGDEIGNIEDLIDELNIILDNQIIIKYCDYDNINFQFIFIKYNSYNYHIIFQYNIQNEIYNIICNSVK